MEHADSATFYGVAMDGKQGISLDNFSVRGSSEMCIRDRYDLTIETISSIVGAENKNTPGGTFDGAEEESICVLCISYQYLFIGYGRT